MPPAAGRPALPLGRWAKAGARARLTLAAVRPRRASIILTPATAAVTSQVNVNAAPACCHCLPCCAHCACRASVAPCCSVAGWPCHGLRTAAVAIPLPLLLAQALPARLSPRWWLPAPCSTYFCCCWRRLLLPSCCCLCGSQQQGPGSCILVQHLTQCCIGQQVASVAGLAARIGARQGKADGGAKEGGEVG